MSKVESNADPKRTVLIASLAGAVIVTALAIWAVIAFTGDKNPNPNGDGIAQNDSEDDSTDTGVGKSTTIVVNGNVENVPEKKSPPNSSSPTNNRSKTVARKPDPENQRPTKNLVPQKQILTKLKEKPTPPRERRIQPKLRFGQDAKPWTNSKEDMDILGCKSTEEIDAGEVSMHPRLELDKETRVPLQFPWKIHFEHKKGKDKRLNPIFQDGNKGVAFKPGDYLVSKGEIYCYIKPFEENGKVEKYILLIEGPLTTEHSSTRADFSGISLRWFNGKREVKIRDGKLTKSKGKWTFRYAPTNPPKGPLVIQLVVVQTRKTTR